MTGKTLRTLRRRAGLVQTQLAQILNVSQVTISKDEKLGVSNIDRIRAYARVFGRDVKELLD